jgi:nucleotide-binding universal stress UspA family protein
VIQLNRILVPVDFSKFSDNALGYACAFAEQFGAELHLMHVLQDVVAMMPEPGLFVPPSGDWLEDLEKSARDELAKLPEPAMRGKLQVVREVRQGAPFLEIIRYAREHKVDLIVLGTHGRSGLAHVLLGSVAEKVVRKSPCPVLSVRHPEHEFVMA